MFFRFLFLLALVSFSPVTFAQEVGAPQTVTVANVSVYEPSIISNENGQLKVGLILSNNSDAAQGDIRYGIDIIKTEENGHQTIVDSFVSSDTLSLSAHEEVTREILYTAPSTLNGNYDIWVVSKTTSGLTLGLGRAGTATFTATRAYIEIVPESCKIKVSGETNTYTVRQGVDVSPNETLSLSCTFINRATESVTAMPVFDTHRRTMYGEAVDAKAITTQSISFAGNEQKTLDIIIPQALEPQAYDVAVTLVDLSTKALLSNKIIAHYVLQGSSATIQNATLDKQSYTQGDTLEAYFLWTPSADGFVGSRQGEGTALPVTMLTMSVVDTHNTPCIVPVTQALTSNQNEFKVQTVVTADCDTPQASLTLTDEGGKILDARTFVSPIEEKVVPESLELKKEPFWSMSTMSIVLATISSLIIFYVVMRMIKGTHVSSVVLKSLILFVFVSGSILFSGVKVDALTIEYREFASWGDWWSIATNTINTNKRVYTPNEIINVSSFIFSLTCSNTLSDFQTNLTFEGSTHTMINKSIWGGGAGYGETTFVAPSVPGVYTIDVESCYYYKFDGEGDGNGGGCTTEAIPITVVAETQCSGTIPANAYAHDAEESEGVSTSQSWARASSDSARKCEFTCNSGYTWRGSSCVFSSAAPALTFSASPTTISSGDNATLSWTVTGTADACWASGGWTGWKSFVGTNSQVVTPANSTTYNLECWNDGVSSGEQKTTVNVNSSVCTGSVPANATLCSGDANGLSSNTTNTTVVSCGPAKCEYICDSTHTLRGGVCVPEPTGSITATPQAVSSNGSSVITWSTQNTTGLVCSVSGGTTGPWNTKSGSMNETLSATRTYYLACGPDYSTLAPLDAVSVTVNTPPTLTGTPHTVSQGDSVVLSWDTNNGNEALCTLTGGALSTNPLNPSLGEVNTGSVNVIANAQTTYTLTCPHGTVTTIIEIVPVGFET